jgi:hypothetical protein
MKSAPTKDSSFLAKMVLLFALVFLAHPERKRGLETYVNRVIAGFQAQNSRVATPAVSPTAQIQPAFSR